MPRRSPTLAIRLLSMLVAQSVFNHRRLAAELGVSVSMLDQWLKAEQPMPLEGQLLLATLLIERVPRLARQGYRLRAHVRAATAYHAHATKTHLTGPVPRFKPLRG